MPNEIYHNYDEGNTLYTIIHKKTDDKVNIIGGNTFEAWVDANIDTYDLAMADNDGDYYSVDFPTTITTAGVYRVTIFKQAGASPHADNDTSIAQGEIYWTGTAEADVYTTSVDLTDIEAKIDIIDGVVDEILVTNNRGTQVIDETVTTPSIQVIVE
jgi:hypothetical protein